MKFLHLADLHIRTFIRHQEYLETFKHLYKSAQEKRPDRIVIAGDTLHGKINVTAELFDIVSNLLKNLTKIAPVDVVLGNHDLTLNNITRLDPLTPIIDAINDKNIRLMKHSGVYPIADQFNYIVMSCIDDKDKWLKYDELSEADKQKTNIVLFHGPIDGTVLENGFKIESEYKLDLFKDFDYVMLGDIHKVCLLDEDCRIAYPGSLVQQNFSEGLEHGYFFWDIKSKNEHDLDFVKLPNICPFYNLELTDDLVVPNNLDYQQGSRIRVVSRELTYAEEKEIKNELKERFSPIEIKFSDKENIVNKDVKISKNLVKIENLRNIDTQESLIKDFLKEHNLDKDTLETIYEINRELDAEITKNDEFIRNIRYKFKYMKFDNLFSYGPDNTINFDDLQGIVGITGKNGSGKSSLIVDIPLYIRHNKISKDVVKNNYYVNQSSTEGYGEIGIELLNDLYVINRSTKIKYSGQKKGDIQEKGITELDFYVLKNKTEKQDLNGIERADTDKNIRRYFGTAEDFMLTSVAAQFDMLSFIKTKGTERKKIISRYFDLDIFQEKYNAANDELKLLKKKISTYEGKDYGKLIEECKKKINENRSKIELLNSRLNTEIENRENIKKDIWALNYKENNYSKEETQIALKMKSIDSKINSLISEMSEFDKYVCLSNPNCCMKQRKQEVQGKLEKEKISKEKIQELFSVLQKKKEEKDTQKEVKIKELNNKLSEVELKCNKTSREIALLNQEIGGEQNKINQYEGEKQSYNKVKREYDSYYYYTKAMGKDGISLSIISQNLIYLNKEIKKLLLNDAGFSVEMKYEEGDINIYFITKKEKPRLIELCSGMERTIAALCIRVALINITSLPSSNILVLDEVFTALDAEYYEVAIKLLNNLKKYFQVIFIISHNDMVKDICDTHLIIERNAKGISQIHGF